MGVAKRTRTCVAASGAVAAMGESVGAGTWTRGNRTFWDGKDSQPVTRAVLLAQLPDGLCVMCARHRRVQDFRVGAPMDRMGVDILGPLTLSDRGNRYVLVTSRSARSECCYHREAFSG